MATTKFLDGEGLKILWKRLLGKFLPLSGGVVTGTIKAPGFVHSQFPNSSQHVLLTNGGTTHISTLGGSGSTSTINATLWGNSFNGSGNVSGDIVFNKPGTLSTVSQGIRLNKSGTNNAGVAVPAEGFIGFTAERGIQPNFYGISLGWGTNPEKSASSVRINDNTFTYKGNKILHTGNYTSIPAATSSTNGLMPYTDKRKLDKMPNTVFGIRLDIDDASTVSYDSPFGDYDIAYKDATVSGVDTIQTNNHYITLIAFDITNDELKNKLQNRFVKFGYSSKDSTLYQTMRLLQSNFDGGYLYIEYIHTEPQYNVSFDCIWELY